MAVNFVILIFMVFISYVTAADNCNHDITVPKNLLMLYYYKENGETKNTSVLLENIGDYFQPGDKVIIITHGWMDQPDKYYFVDLREAILIAKPQYKLVMTDWSYLSAAEYIYTAQVTTSDIGKYIAHFCMELYIMGVELQDMILMGHSLGAHISGFAGKYFQESVVSQKIGRIYALDPAGPTFNGLLKLPDRRISKEDANEVIILHTNDLLLGNRETTGTADFYANGGLKQPHCNTDITEIVGACSHISAVNYMTESITRDQFISLEIICSSTFGFTTCEDGTKNLKFNLELPLGTRGSYKFCTNPNPPPFGTGQLC